MSALNEFVYCPRRYYYQRYYDEIGEPYELVDAIDIEPLLGDGMWEVTDISYGDGEISVEFETDRPQLTPSRRPTTGRSVIIRVVPRS